MRLIAGAIFLGLLTIAAAQYFGPGRYAVSEQSLNKSQNAPTALKERDVAPAIQGISGAPKDSFAINGQNIVVPNPKGFVRVTDKMTVLQSFLQKMGDDPLNDTLAVYIPESAAPAAMAGEIPIFEKYFILKISKISRNVRIGKNDFLQLRKFMGTQMKVLMADIGPEMEKTLEKNIQETSRTFDVDFSARLSPMVPLDIHYDEENAFASSMYLGLRVTTDGKEENEVRLSATMTMLNASGVVLALYGYAPERKLEWTRAASKSWAENVMASNSQPPEEFLSRQIDDEETVAARVTNLFLSPAEKTLMAGAAKGDAQLVERGILEGASPDTSFLGNHALFMAAIEDHREVIALLLRHGADIDRLTVTAGRTALHQAALKGHLRSAQLLLDHGANVNARNLHGRTPLYYVVSPPLPLGQSANWEEMKVLLLRYGAGM